MKHQNVFDRTVTISGVHGGNLHTTWFCSIGIPKGNSFAIKERTCLFRVGFSQAIRRPSIIFSSERWVSRCMQCSMCIYIFIYIYMFQHSANSLFDLWLFLLRWPHTPQAFLETSPPSRPLMLERTGQPQHRGFYPVLFSNSGFVNVPQRTYEHRRHL